MLAPVVAGPCFVLLFALRDVIHQKGVKTFALSLFLRDKRIELPVQRAFRFEASRNLGARGVELLAGLLDSFAQRDRHRYSFAVGSPGRCSATISDTMSPCVRSVRAASSLIRRYASSVSLT
jgi:hypothetical protein